MVLNNDAARKLANMLLGEDTAAEPVSITVPKTVPGLEAVAPGWCSPRGSPRRPMLHVPAGTVLEIETDYSTIERLVREGVELNTRQGWGTMAATCIE